MTSADSVPPPLETPTTPAARPKVPLAVILFTTLAGVLTLVVVCAGGIAFGVAHRAQAGVERSLARRETALRDRDRAADVKARFDVMAARLVAKARVGGELPEALDEAPPRDPWGRPVEYVRSAPERAVLRSAGPDGRLGTGDDVRYDVIFK